MKRDGATWRNEKGTKATLFYCYVGKWERKNRVCCDYNIGCIKLSLGTGEF